MKISKFLLFTIFFLFTISLSGAVITWTGGTGDWDIDSNWDTGTIPSSSDDVIISSGYVTIPAGYSAVALSVSISNSSTLEIANTGALQIDNASVNGIAISTGASLLNAGEINIGSPVIFGIENSTGTFHNQSTGEIYITSAGTGGIKNFGAGAILTNDGLISINETGSGDGIYSETVFNNNINASIIIKNTATNGLDSYGGLLTNDGDITIDSTGADGMLITGNTFDNSGDVEISHCYDGLGSNGAMGIYAIAGIKNKSGGSIYIHHVESSALRTVGDLENDGLIEIYDNSYIGVFVGDGTLSNQETGEIKLKNNGNHAIHLYRTALENDGLLLFNNNTGMSVNATEGSTSDNKTNGNVKGNGLMSGGDFFDSGTLSPGDSIGSLEIFGYKPTLPNYNMEIVGPNGAGVPGGYDLLTLNFSNSYLLQGTVNVSFLGDYTGASQDTFYMFSIPLGYTGTFDLINLPALPAGLSWEPTIYSSDGVKFVIDGMVTWTGTVSQDWNDPSNWDKSFAPNEVNDVIIPDVSGASGNFPGSNTGTAMVCNNLTIETGAQFTVPETNGALDVGENLLLYGTLTIAPNADATISGDTYIDAAEGLIVEATSAGIGSFIDNGTITYGASGTAKVQTYLSNSAGDGNLDIHLIGPTVDEENYTGTGTGAFLSAFAINSGTYAYEWDETLQNANGWQNIYSLTYEVVTGDGIALSTTDNTDHTLEMTGSLMTGPASSPLLTYSNNFNELISNPYPSTIDFDALAGIDNSALVHNKYLLFNPVSNVYEAFASPYNGDEMYIQAGQAFFVETKSGGAFSFDNSRRTHSNVAFRSTIPNMLTVKAFGGQEGYEDKLTVRFDENATGGYDIDNEVVKWDSENNDATTIRSIAEDNTELAINVLPIESLTNGMTCVPVHFSCGYDTEYTLSFYDMESFETGTEIWLEDKQLGGEWISINTNPDYNFTATPDDLADRFVIHFSGPTGIDDLDEQHILIYSANEYTYIKNLTKNEVIKEVYIYSLAGNMILHKQLPEQNQYRFYVSNHIGYYVVRVVTDKRIYSEKVFFH